MALQTSGAISLNQIHIEAGGTSAAQVSLNDSDVRGLISKASGASMSFNEWYGASASTHTITQGIYNNEYYGYWSGLSMGAIADVPDGSQIGNSYFNNGSINLNVLSTMRNQNPTSGFNFMVQMNYSSPVASDAFDSLTLTANGSTVTMYTSDAYSSGSYTRTWLWNLSFGLTTSQISNLTTEFDGSGSIDVKYEA